MELEVGKRYKLKNKIEWFNIEVLSVGKSSYYMRVDNASIESSRIIDHEFHIPKQVYNDFQIMEIGTREPDHIIYTPELINLYIEMALQTNDREWFMELTELKKGVVA